MARATAVEPEGHRPSTTILLALGAVVAVAAFVPFGTTLLYPLTLFTTWVHEMGHGLTEIAVGGHFERLEIFANASGLAQGSGYDEGWQAGVVALGGLLAPPIVGSLLLAFAHGRRRARAVLAMLAVALVVSVVLYVRSAVGVIALPVVAAGLGYVAWREADWCVFVVQVLGVLLGLDTVTRMVGYVFESSVEVDGVKLPSDIANVATGLGGHWLLWGAAVTVVAVGLIAAALWWAWRPVRARSARPRRA